MSITYVCDCCKKPIRFPNQRIAVQLKRVAKGDTFTYHACAGCYSDLVQPLFTGDLYDRIYNSKDKEEVSEPIILEESEELPVIVPTVDDFNKPLVNRYSQYFTQANCYHIHRLFLLNTKLTVMSNKLGIPYQTLKNYRDKFDKSVAEKYKPEDVSQADEIIQRFSKVIPTYLSLFQALWSVEDVAEETGSGISNIQYFYELIPYMYCKGLINE